MPLDAIRCPVVLVTGYGSERLDEEVLRDAAWLRKPIDGYRLARAMVEMLAGQGRG